MDDWTEEELEAWGEMYADLDDAQELADSGLLEFDEFDELDEREFD